MVKKASSKKKKGSAGVVYQSTGGIKIERELIENFIGLQKVMVNLSAKFDSLAGQISRLLDLFEISAKALARKEVSSSGNLEAKRVMEKLDNLSHQAGLIGKGLALIHEVRTEREPMPPSIHTAPFLVSPPSREERFQPSILPSTTTSPPVIPGASSMTEPQRKMTRELGEYEKPGTIGSISNREKIRKNAGTNI